MYDAPRSAHCDSLLEHTIGKATLPLPAPIPKTVLTDMPYPDRQKPRLPRMGTATPDGRSLLPPLPSHLPHHRLPPVVSAMEYLRSECIGTKYRYRIRLLVLGRAMLQPQQFLSLPDFR